MNDKITIIEGPTPEFQEVNGLWIQGITESPLQFDALFTELRAFNGAKLVERCRDAWRNQELINLEYRNESGLIDEIPIIAAHYDETEKGDILQLWVRQLREDVEFEIKYDDSEDEDIF
ncbi:MAG: hypothetical protein R6U57_00300 [Anaerolineales bacterium]